MKIILNNKIKVILCTILSIILITISICPSLASASTLKITNTLVGKTYDAYLFFEMNNGNMTIKNDSVFKSSLDQFNNEHPGKFIVTQIDTDTYKVVPSNSFTEDDSAILAQTAMIHYNEWKYEKVASQTATSNTVTFDNLEKDGYYLVKSSAGTILSMVTVNGEGTINEKNAGCDWGLLEFSILEDASGYHEQAHFEATFTFTQDYRGSEKQLAIEEIYADGNNTPLFLGPDSFDIVYKDTGERIDSNMIEIILLEDHKGFIVRFSYRANFNAGDAIVIKSTATATENLNLYSTQESLLDKNVMTINAYDWYSSNPDESIGVASDTTCTLGASLTKVPNDSDIVLNGAAFKMYRSEASTEPVHFIKQDIGDGINQYTVTEAGTGTTDIIQAGAVRIIGLGSNTYWFEEIEAPQGYNPLRDRVSHRLTDDSDFATYNNIDNVKHYISGGLVIINHQGVIIPSTGGVGTIILIIIGAGIIIGTFSYRLSRRKVSSDCTNTI